MIGLKKQQEKKKEEAERTGTPAESQPKIEDNDKMVLETPDTKETSSSNTTAGPVTSSGRGRGTTSIFGVKGSGQKSGGSGQRRMKPGEIRVQKDVGELDGGECAVPRFPNPNDLMNFEVVITPNDGYWAGFSYTFSFTVPDMYPHEPPKVHCNDPIYHPNIDLKGNVCLNILRADWKPVLDLNAVIYGLIILFEKPNGDDPLNHEAAKCLRENPAKFKQNVERSLRGLDVDGVSFPPARKGDKKSVKS